MEDREQAPDDMVDLAGMRLGSTPMRAMVWPPKLAKAEEGADARRLALDRLEGRRGSGLAACDVPSLSRWPAYEADIAALRPLAEGDEELTGYRVMDLTRSLDQAYAIANRWKRFNDGRSLGFTQTGAARLSSSVVTLPILLRQLQGLAVFRQRRAADQGAADAATVEFFEAFVANSGADSEVADELRTVVVGTGPASGHVAGRRLAEIRVDALVGIDHGSALAVWAVEPDQRIARVEFCIGHDCLDKGPEAEGALLRLVAHRAAAAGAAVLRCRCRFTDGGRLFAPPCFSALGFRRPEAAAAFEEDTGDESDELRAREAAAEEEYGAHADVASAPEAVDGLLLWLQVQGLERHLQVVNAWCEEMGAATLAEVIEAREDLADHLGDRLSAVEREEMLKRSY